jgi:hypothetical protein
MGLLYFIAEENKCEIVLTIKSRKKTAARD